MTPTPDLHLEAVVPAAGLSCRAGTFKPAWVVDGRALLRHAVDGLRPWCRRIVVVTGHEHERAAALVADLAGVVAVHNPRYREDMFLSVQAGAAALAADAAGFFVLPADCPFVAAEVHQALIAAFVAADRACGVVPEHAGRGGHPVLLPITAREAILSAGAGCNLRRIVAASAPLRVPVGSASILADLDTPADLAALCGDGPRPGRPGRSAP